VDREAEREPRVEGQRRLEETRRVERAREGIADERQAEPAPEVARRQQPAGTRGVGLDLRHRPEEVRQITPRRDAIAREERCQRGGAATEREHERERGGNRALAHASLARPSHSRLLRRAMAVGLTLGKALCGFSELGVRSAALLAVSTTRLRCSRLR
jgi:hypothetical protein